MEDESFRIGTLVAGHTLRQHPSVEEALIRKLTWWLTDAGAKDVETVKHGKVDNVDMDAYWFFTSGSVPHGGTLPADFAERHDLKITVTPPPDVTVTVEIVPKCKASL